jgi:hypothetical protein
MQILRSEVAKELREVQAKIAEERKVAAEDQLKRIDSIGVKSGSLSSANAVDSRMNSSTMFSSFAGNIPNRHGNPRDLHPARRRNRVQRRFGVVDRWCGFLLSQPVVDHILCTGSAVAGKDLQFHGRLWNCSRGHRCAAARPLRRIIADMGARGQPLQVRAVPAVLPVIGPRAPRLRVCESMIGWRVKISGAAH